jgi:hypothetical protein
MVSEYVVACLKFIFDSLQNIKDDIIGLNYLSHIYYTIKFVIIICI